MAEPENAQMSPKGWWLRILGASIALFFLVMVLVGFLVAHQTGAGSLSTAGALILAAVVLAALGCLWLLVRTWKIPTGQEPLTRKERLNRNILIASGATGGFMAVAVMLAGDDLEHANVFSSTPLPPAIALAMVLGLGVVVPALSIYWHRAAIDEQEADAYKTGALYAMYLYMVGAPVWWFAWRGGFVSAPDGVTIYFLTIITLAVVWLWKKYR